MHLISFASLLHDGDAIVVVCEACSSAESYELDEDVEMRHRHHLAATGKRRALLLCLSRLLLYSLLMTAIMTVTTVTIRGQRGREGVRAGHATASGKMAHPSVVFVGERSSALMLTSVDDATTCPD